MVDELLLLADFTAKSLLLLAIAAIATRCFKQNSTRQRIIWISAFVAILLIGLAEICLPARTHLFNVKSASVPSSTLSALTANQTLSTNWQHWLLYAWLLGLVGVLGYGAGCWRLLSRLKANSEVIESLKDLNFNELARQAKVRGPWQLRLSDGSMPTTALTWGWRRPVILLPNEASEWTPLQLKSVLLHELAHIRRADGLIQLLILFVSAVQWFNPAVWLAARAYRANAEVAADEIVLEAGVKATDYAAVLLSLISELGSSRPTGAQLGSTILSRLGIEDRIQAIVSSQPRALTTRTQTLSTACVATVFFLALTAVQIAVAQSPPAGAIPAIYQGKSLEWRQGYEAAKRYLKETPSTPPSWTSTGPAGLTAKEAYELERRLQDSQRRSRGG